MRTLSILAINLACLTASLALAAEARIDIVSPADGSKLTAVDRHMFAYEVTLGGGGDHAHLYVDGKEMAVLRQAKGSITLDQMERGVREICAKMVNKNHTPIGIERCIKVTVE
ncbi:MAG: hypothetical protein A3F73_00455 [Gallionellales bacterium RIFCSPLOWO2_12_FULL_59_22]|nr:MAG: hypothetical protein A3H99_03510 [Gallionellales bacterium RIFCSPLOWO2_02_FULL_59_110]OGT03779.1 MAG: hypothetical protein A2Z65_03995 [Gallionellales bacterium RIFCSPLOWO2_02_58_13]OGT13010.1 MAG: hypothetical protein A3F73_00455 [Gallionellales bacterium RIFCSPLOWO2_12_FULL_59_22]